MTSDTSIEPITVARRVVELADEKQASDIILLDLRALAAFTDYFVICSADNERQLKALLAAIDETIGAEFGWDARVEGLPVSGWIVLDYGDVVVHLFSSALRDYYRVERLWSRAVPVVVVQ
ncbi:MAG: ribosome silencing factor [Chloroflexi bacterium]|nr:ribosome silencing factor [Chloroflexota bacterium]